MKDKPDEIEREKDHSFEPESDEQRDELATETDYLDDMD